MSGDWNTTANWVPATVPNATTDVAIFGPSRLTSISSERTDIDLDSLIFNSGAPSYTITLDISGYFLSGAGIVNNSGLLQSFVFPQDGDFGGGIFFFNSATAGDMTTYSAVDGYFSFHDTSSAGSATFNLSSAAQQASMNFWESSTAGEVTINASAGSLITFLDSSTGSNATLNLSSAAFVLVPGSFNAEHITINCIGGNQSLGSALYLEGFATAGEGNFTSVGGSTVGEHGGYIELDNTATAADGTFTIGGGLGAGLNSGVLVFLGKTTAANASITANGGAGGSEGGLVIFAEKSKGGAASLTLNGNAELDLSARDAPGITIGSLSGAGAVFLGANTLTVGSNNQSTTFSGVIQETGGVSKIGTGTLALSGANTYTGLTTVSGGVLNAGNKNGSATGFGAVNVNSGTLGGRGLIAGPTTISSGAFLAPAVGSSKQTTLTLQSALTLNASATYTYSFKAKKNKSRTDLVVANGVTINGATINLVGQIQGSLEPGLTLTVLSNTSATPINGAFSNLPNGAVVSVNGNNFQASYSGGDGNDLTLTVVP